MTRGSFQRAWGPASLSLFLVAFVLASAGRAQAAPEAHILRIDPRAGVDKGQPVLTVVTEVVQFNPLSQVLQPCASTTGYERTLSCWSDELEKPGNLYTPIPFPDQPYAHLLVKVDGSDQPTKFVDKVQWDKASGQPNVGTAWLVALDASSAMGSRYGEAREVARAVIEAMGPNDLMDLMIFDDRQVIRDSKWKTFAQRNDLVTQVLNAQTSTAPSHGSGRALFDQIKGMTKDGFGSLGNLGAPEQLPLHQAMVVLSNGAGRNDAASAAPTAEVFHQYLNGGRFPETNTSLPKTPLPMISIWFPNKSGTLTNDLYKNNDAQFMQSLANVEIGGFFDVVQEGQGSTKGKTIINLVKGRFNKMWITHWRLSCLNTSLEQTFNLVFENTKPLIAPDGSFKDVPIGINPTEWPLDVDFDKTLKEAQTNPLYPGGQFNVYGDFCWGGDPTRAEAYFVPKGTKPNPQQTNSRDPELAKKAMQQLKAQNMVGKAVAAGDTYVTLTIPDDENILEGTGDNTVARVVIYDNKAKRASAVDEKSVLSLKATKKPLNWLLILGISGGVIVILLLAVVLLRGGGNKRRGGAPPPPSPGPYGGPGGYGGPQGPGYGGGGPGYGAPPGGGYGGAPPPGGGYGGPPPGGGGGYGMQPNAPAGAAFGGSDAYAPPPAPAPQAPAGGMFAPPAVAPPPVVGAGALPPPQAAAIPSEPMAAAVVQVRCPSCSMTTMATPGQPSVCFSCGQPLPADVVMGGGGGAHAPSFPLTGALGAQPMQPPPNPYAQEGGALGGGGVPFVQGGGPTAATIIGSAGQFSVRPGAEVRVGRDPAQCPIYLSEPRVSGVHATLKFEGGQLHVRDETSNNGTWIAGARIAPGFWVPVPAGSSLRFGPLEFNIRLEG